MKSNRLGKGLEALIPDVASDESPSRKESLFDIEVHLLDSHNFTEAFHDAFELYHGRFVAGSHLPDLLVSLRL